MIGIGIGIILLWGLVFPFTDWYVRFVSRRTIKEGAETGTKICLSFDDGPDPRYTPEVLKILREFKVPAVFFLVGAKAERSPDLVKRIEAEGHQIGCHTYDHRHAYLLSPRKSLATISEGRQAIEKITGKTLRWFRPPWGALNLFQYRFLKQLGLQTVLWNANARDWNKKTGASGILKRLLKKVKPNSIIVLHDSGGEKGAPENTVAALPGIIKWLQNNGYTFVSLEEALGGDLKC
ncbi:MAG: polysaccharide deacetylase family protein [Bacteroidota bacterium]